jgi:hypothetical protein
MGRKPKINAPQDVPAVEDDQDFFDEVLAGFDEENGVEIEGRIYRKTKPEDSIGRMSFEAIAKVSEIVDEDWIGRHFGGGNYFIKWTFKQGERKEIRQKNYAVGPEYDKFVKEAAPAVSGTVPGVSGLDLGGLLGSLTVEKIAAIGSAIKLVKDIFAPPPPPAPVDITKLLEIIATNSNKQSVSDAIVIESMRAMKQQNAQPPQTLAQQIADFKALKETFKDEFSSDSTEGGDEMNFLLEKAIEYLPLLLQKKNNDFRAVGAEARENPLIKSVISSNPELTQKFFEQARATYGDAAVQQLAAGFGLKATIIPAQTGEGVQNGSEEN